MHLRTLRQSLASSLAAVLLFAWVFALGFRPVTNNDYWFHLRVGEDILDSGEIPYVDAYSHVAPDKPFVDQGWLAAVALAFISRHAGGLGVTLLGALAGLATAALCYGALPNHLRARSSTLLLLALCFYLIDFAIALRPVTFAIPILAAFAFSLERWRRSRRFLDLLPLVPLQLVWTNVHGSFLFGPLLLWGLVACCAALAVIPGLQRVPDEADYRWDDVLNLAFVALGCSAVMFVTPYGAGALAVTLETWGTNELVRRLMTEWHAPFAAESYFREHFQYLFGAYVALLVLLGLGLALRVKERPVFDTAIAAVTVYLSLQANRFIPYAAIFGFPILVRSWAAIISRVAAVRSFRFPAAAVFVMMVLLLGATIRFGYPYGFGAYGTLGWGIAERMPRAEAEFIREHGWSGVVYNEVMTDGSYLLYALYPRVRPAIDAHLGGGETALAEYEGTRSSRSRLDSYLAKYDVRLALVIPDSWMVEHLGRQGGWKTALRTPKRTVLVRE